MVLAQDEEDEEERVLETNEASDDELEAEHRETMALITIAKQRRAEVDQARQFFRKKRNSKESRVSNQRGRNTHPKDTLISSGMKENVVFFKHFCVAGICALVVLKLMVHDVSTELDSGLQTERSPLARAWFQSAITSRHQDRGTEHDTTARKAP